MSTMHIPAPDVMVQFKMMALTWIVEDAESYCTTGVDNGRRHEDVRVIVASVQMCLFCSSDFTRVSASCHQLQLLVPRLLLEPTSPVQDPGRGRLATAGSTAPAPPALAPPVPWPPTPAPPAPAPPTPPAPVVPDSVRSSAPAPSTPPVPAAPVPRGRAPPGPVVTVPPVTPAPAATLIPPAPVVPAPPAPLRRR
ncbi:unnamed protein product, partial [Closterium sp. NIES-54]